MVTSQTETPWTWGNCEGRGTYKDWAFDGTKNVKDYPCQRCDGTGKLPALTLEEMNDLANPDNEYDDFEIGINGH